MIEKLLNQGGAYLLMGVEFADIDEPRWWRYDWVLVPENDWRLLQLLSERIMERSKGLGVRLTYRVTNHGDLHPGEEGKVIPLCQNWGIDAIMSEYPAHE